MVIFDCIIIGGGASGFFSALQFGQAHPGARLLMLEKSSKLLAKVKVSGGGRCNVTNELDKPSLFAANYPRGSKFMKKALHVFSQADCIAWFENHGVILHAEADGRMFPTSNQSQTVIDCFMQEADRLGIRISTEEPVSSIQKLDSGHFLVHTSKQELKTKTIILATGGHPKKEGYSWLSSLGIKIIDPIPSLFTFNVKPHPLNELMGLSVHAEVRIEGTSIKESGPLLITHWGFSGPAVLKCSARAARILAESNYHFTCRIHWMPELNQEEIREWLLKQRTSQGGRLVKNKLFDALPQRLWEALVERSEISLQTKWSETSNKQMNKLAETLTADPWQIDGKTTFKEEFVTCGGIDLQEIDPNTCMIKAIPGLFAVGELLDVDGITGGFNFQNAWSTGYLAGVGASAYIKQHRF